MPVAPRVIGQTSADLPITGLTAGRYLVTFTITDWDGNSTTTMTDFFLDQVSFNVSAAAITIPAIAAGQINYSDTELTFTVRTVGAGFRVVMLK